MDATVKSNQELLQRHWRGKVLLAGWWYSSVLLHSDELYLSPLSVLNEMTFPRRKLFQGLSLFPLNISECCDSAFLANTVCFQCSRWACVHWHTVWLYNKVWLTLLTYGCCVFLCQIAFSSLISSWFQLYTVSKWHSRLGCMIIWHLLLMLLVYMTCPNFGIINLHLHYFTFLATSHLLKRLGLVSLSLFFLFIITKSFFFFVLSLRKYDFIVQQKSSLKRLFAHRLKVLIAWCFPSV